MTWPDIFMLVYFGLLLSPVLVLGLFFLVAGVLWYGYWFIIWLDNPWVDRKASIFVRWLCQSLKRSTDTINNHLAKHGDSRRGKP